MDNWQILKQTFLISTTSVGLWLLGIFLSSAFNLHWLYSINWLREIGFLSDLFQLIRSLDPLSFWFGIFIILAGGILILNILKLWFFIIAHDKIHPEESAQCIVCSRKKNELTHSQIILRKEIIWRTCLASLITIVLTASLLLLFNFYNIHSEPNIVTQIILLISLAIVMIAVSLWNIAMVMFILFFEQSFARSAMLAHQMLIINIKKTVGFTLLVTAIFLFAVTAGSLIILQIPVMLGSSSTFLLTANLQMAWQSLVSGVSIVLFLVWLVINNVFFNVSFIVLFDGFVKGKKVDELDSILVITRTEQVITHHFNTKT